MSVAADSATLVRRQAATVALLVAGYAGYYLCRSNFSVVLPLLIDELAANGMMPDEAKVRLGAVASLGVFAYAFGKFASGGLADGIGGRRAVLSGAAGAIAFTLLFASSGTIPLFTLAWLANRLAQSMGWPGTVKLVSRWFSFSAYGTAMGIVSLSYLFGDAAARELMGWLLARGLGWRAVFVVCAGVLSAIFVVMLLFLKESPRDVGFAEPPADPRSLIGEEGAGAVPFGATVRVFLTSPAFLIVCALSLGCTLLRETFNTWTPTYFTQVVGLGRAEAASKSALFPFFGGVSVLVAGFVSDALGRHGRAILLVAGLSLSCVALIALGGLERGVSPTIAVALVSAVALALIGPYSYLGGALSLDFGGKRGAATASGIIDGVGYLGGVLAGGGVASVSVAYGWRGAFGVLAAVAFASALAAVGLLAMQRRGV
jgi:OPA family glycerol-3-phosphate transporter-like MFS transporter